MASDSGKVHLIGQHFSDFIEQVFDFNRENDRPSLNQYFQHMFQEKCEFKVSQNEVERIQTIIESRVNNLLSSVVESDSYSACLNKSDVSCILHSENLKTYNEAKLLKVGSFYEGTKNTYPDEFDFIYILAEFDISHEHKAKRLLSQLSDVFHSCLESMSTNSQEMKYYGLHGPASKLEVELIDSQVKYVHVDISVACRVRLNNDVPSFLKIRSKKWKKAIKEKDSFLLMKIYRDSHPKHKTRIEVTVTESEKYYVRAMMNENHRRVYRLLKYLINGTSLNETLRQIVRHPDNSINGFAPMNPFAIIVFDFSSFVLKTLVLLHEDKCTENDNITQCIIQVIGSILEVFKDENDRFSKFWVIFNQVLRRDRYSVNIESVAGNTLEIADDFESAIEITQRFEDIHTKLRFHKEIQSDEIPINKTFVNLAKKAMERKQQTFPSKRLGKKINIFILVIFLTFTTLALVVSAVCPVESNTQPNNNHTNNSHLVLDDLICTLQKKTKQPDRTLLCIRFFFQDLDQVATDQFYGFEQDIFCHSVSDDSARYIVLNDTSTSPCKSFRCSENISPLIMDFASNIKTVELRCADIGEYVEEKAPFCKHFDVPIDVLRFTALGVLGFITCRDPLYLCTKRALTPVNPDVLQTIVVNETFITFSFFYLHIHNYFVQGWHRPKAVF